MSTFIKCNLLAIVFFFMCSSMNAQILPNDEIEFFRKFKKNTVYSTVGFGGLYASMTLYYERILYQEEGCTVFGKVGYGKYVEWEGDGLYFLTQVGVIMGEQNHHFELGEGLVHFF